MLGMIRPMILADFLNKERATSLGTKSVCSMTSNTRFRLSGLTLAVPFMTRETVAGETPANRATSRTLLMCTPPSNLVRAFRMTPVSHITIIIYYKFIVKKPVSILHFEQSKLSFIGVSHKSNLFQVIFHKKKPRFSVFEAENPNFFDLLVKNIFILAVSQNTLQDLFLLCKTNEPAVFSLDNRANLL